MKQILSDGARWSTTDDVYDAFFRAVGAQEWHGRNFDALRDGVAAGSINQVEVPYQLVIKNYDKINGDAKTVADDFIALLHELAAEGCPIEVRAEASDSGSKRSRIQQHRLADLESEFEQALIPV